MTALSTERLYDRRFFLAFAAVMLFMTGVSLQFHFGQYLGHLGHGVGVQGRVLSISMVGTLCIRLLIGRWIDRFGCRPTWIVGTVVVAAAVGSVQFTERLWLIVGLRALSTMAAASVMTTVAVFAAQMAPPPRRAESIGTIGLAGFLGMIMGPTLGDYIFAGATDSIGPYRIFFSASAGCSLLACAIMMLMPMPGGGESGAEAGPRSGGGEAGHGSTSSMIRRHWPGAILLVSVVFHMVFCLQTLFLERLAEAAAFKDIKAFFLVYCPTAIVLRIVFRRMPERIGRGRTLLLGLTLLTAGLLCMVGVGTEAGLILPGLLMGAGHSFIYPSMVDLGAGRLPSAYRGTGTALILGAGDLGMLTGYALLGEVIDGFGFDVALVSLAAMVVFGAVVFGLAGGKARPVI